MSQCPPVAVCPGPDFLALLAALGAEFGDHPMGGISLIVAIVPIAPAQARSSLRSVDNSHDQFAGTW
jgi:hypothetical protein